MRKLLIVLAVLLVLATIFSITAKIGEGADFLKDHFDEESDPPPVPEPEPEPDPAPNPNPDPGDNGGNEDDGRIYLCERLEVYPDSQGSVTDPVIDGGATYYCTVHLVVQDEELEYNLGPNTPYFEEGLGEYSLTFGGGDEPIYISYYDSTGWYQWNPDGVPVFISIYYYANENGENDDLPYACDYCDEPYVNESDAFYCCRQELCEVCGECWHTREDADSCCSGEEF